MDTKKQKARTNNLSKMQKPILEITKIKLVSEFIENIEKERNNITHNIEALPHSVLTKAFRGKLIV